MASQRRGTSGLVNEVTRLRDQLGREQAETAKLVEQYTAQINGLVKENCQLQGKLLNIHENESSRGVDTSAVKRDVLEKNAAIEALMRELQQQQQATVEKIKSLAGAMLASCTSRPQEATPALPAARMPSAGAAPDSAADGRAWQHEGASPLPAKAASLEGGRPWQREGASPTPGKAISLDGSPCMASGTTPAGAMNDHMLDAEGQRWFRSVKANLEHFGGVEVFMDGSVRDCACCLEPLNTVYRIRPKKCRHVFHVECLLQWWSEGNCPVCNVSFAPSPGRVGSSLQSVEGQGSRSSDGHATPSSERGSAQWGMP